MQLDGQDGAKPTRAQRREQLLASSVEAIRELGAGASMEQLARWAGVTKPILYRHFGHRDGLIAAIGAVFSGDLTDRLERARADARPFDLLRLTIDGYLGLLEADPELYAFLAHHAPNARSAEVEASDLNSLTDQVARRMAAMMAERFADDGLDPRSAEPLAFGVVGLLHHAGDWWIRTRTMPRDALTDQLTSLLWGGFRNLGPRPDGPPTTTPVPS